MRRPVIALLAVLSVSLAGCLGRSSSVATVSASDTAALRNAPLRQVYFVPFDTATVKLEGDHGQGAKIAENKRKWASHVVAGAQRAMSGRHAEAILVRGAKEPYDDLVMEKGKVRYRIEPKAPEKAVVVSGRYVSSHNVGGSSRFWLGSMSGKSWNRAEVTIRKDGAVVFKGTVDGKYLGSGYSWGYETLGVNEGLGAGIVEILDKLSRGEKVAAK